MIGLLLQIALLCYPDSLSLWPLLTDKICGEINLTLACLLIILLRKKRI